MGTGTFAEIIDACRIEGSNIEGGAWAVACWRVALTLAPNMDDGDARHLEILLGTGDRLAAALMLVPANWGYQVHRSCEGDVTVRLELPGRGPQPDLTSDDEGAAVLGAIAATLGPLSAS
jgi:hypothetical protein